MKLTREDFEKLETKELANIIRKLGEGKTLTKREQEKLEKARSADPAEAKQEFAPVNFAHTWDELARVLTQRAGVSVTRRSLQTWRTREDLAGIWPRDRADGRKDVSAWIQFMQKHGLHRADELLEGDERDEERKTILDWKEHREKLMCSKLEREIARGDDLLLVAAELEVPIGATLVAVQTKLSQFPPRVARFMVGRRDEAEAEEKLRDEIDAVLADLNFGNYLDDSLAEIIGSLPFDGETEKLFELVTFDGQDRSKLLQLIECVTRETLRRVGRAAIAAERTGSPEDSEPETFSTVPAVRKSENNSANPKSEAPPARAAGHEAGTGAAPAAEKSSAKRRMVTPRRKRAAKGNAPKR